MLGGGFAPGSIYLSAGSVLPAECVSPRASFENRLASPNQHQLKNVRKACSCRCRYEARLPARPAGLHQAPANRHQLISPATRRAAKAVPASRFDVEVDVQKRETLAGRRVYPLTVCVAQPAGRYCVLERQWTLSFFF